MWVSVDVALINVRHLISTLGTVMSCILSLLSAYGTDYSSLAKSGTRNTYQLYGASFTHSAYALIHSALIRLSRPGSAMPDCSLTKTYTSSVSAHALIAFTIFSPFQAINTPNDTAKTDIRENAISILPGHIIANSSNDVTAMTSGVYNFFCLEVSFIFKTRMLVLLPLDLRELCHALPSSFLA